MVLESEDVYNHLTTAYTQTYKAFSIIFAFKAADLRREFISSVFEETYTIKWKEVKNVKIREAFKTPKICILFSYVCIWK